MIRDATGDLAPATRDVLEDVIAERERQELKWGEQNHGPMPWTAILGEEFGEACEEALNVEFGHDPGIDPHSTPSEALRAELVQVTAVAVSWIECIDRHRQLRRAA